MSDARNDELERRSLVRALRQHLESLARAGIDRIPTAPEFEAVWQPLESESPEPDQAPPRIDLDRPVWQPPASTLAALPRSAEAVSAGPVATPNIPTPAPRIPMPSLFDANEFDTDPIPLDERPALLNTLATEVAGCRRCPHLAETRTQTVFGVGPSLTRLMFVGEAPGADEDRLGEPFVGRAGQLLTDMITKGMGLARDQVYIANVIKCRPPENRTPTLEECANCGSYLDQQIAIIRPEFLCLLGRVAVQYLLKTSLAMGRLRGKWHRYRGIPTVVTYHPAYLLRNPVTKKETWEDLQMLMKAMGLRIPSRSRTDAES